MKEVFDIVFTWDILIGPLLIVVGLWMIAITINWFKQKIKKRNPKPVS